MIQYQKPTFGLMEILEPTNFTESYVLVTQTSAKCC